MRACAGRGGENICPCVPTRRAQSGSGPVPARLWCTGLHVPSPPRSRPLAHSQGPPPRELFPGLGLKGAATSHEVSQSLSFSTHTIQSCGKKNLVQSLFSRYHSRIQESSGLFIGAGAGGGGRTPPIQATPGPRGHTLHFPPGSHPLSPSLLHHFGLFPLPKPPPPVGPGTLFLYLVPSQTGAGGARRRSVK